jgi:hypothetical protein
MSTNISFVSVKMADAPEAPPPVVANADVHAVLTVCGFANVADRT